MATKKQKSPPKLWGWKDGVFGNPLPKKEFKSGFKPKVRFDPPKGLENTIGYWLCGEYIVVSEKPKKDQRTE